MISAATERGRYLPSAPCANSRSRAPITRSAALTAVNASNQPTIQPIEGSPSVLTLHRSSRNGTTRNTSIWSMTDSPIIAPRPPPSTPVAAPSKTTASAAIHFAQPGSGAGSAWSSNCASIEA